MQFLKCFVACVPVLLVGLTACSDDPESGPSPGDTTGGVGAQPSGGASSGGALGSGGTGGLPSGGVSTGGAATGGGAPTSGGVGGSGGELGSGGSGAMATGGAGEEVETLDDGSPLLLSDTGLYRADMTTLAEGIRPFEPRFTLWTDGATKRRWIWLPEGETIDTSDMDYWQFPVGTRVFKEFSRGGVRVETRMMTKRERGGWQRVAYQWRDDQLEANALLDGLNDASGTEHDIPSQKDCGTCHFNMPDKVLGFSAIQLAWDNPDPDAWTLARLQEESKLSDAPPAIQLPGDATAQHALGYMHANCGHCHNPQSSVTTRVTVNFWLTTESLGSIEETPTYLSSACKPIELEEGGVPGIDTILDPGSPATSSIFQRVDRRGDDFAMPPLGTELVDMDGRDAIQQWIQALDPSACQ